MQAFEICIRRIERWWESLASTRLILQRLFPVFAAAFKAFQRDYLIVYWIMQFADWMQGPYIYALYSERKFSQGTVSNPSAVGSRA